MNEHTTPAGRPLVPDTASWAQRVGALVIDWATSSLAAAFILGGFSGSAYQWLPLGLFWLQSSIGVALAGGSFGQSLLRLNVRRLDGHPLSLLRALERQLLICLVIPPLVFRADGRGLHDILTESAVFVRRRT
ncbi:MAG: RDD family protein [Propionibacteriales bacterium]|nr:RDD family protein [Propionibacteriales bacterium]